MDRQIQKAERAEDYRGEHLSGNDKRHGVRRPYSVNLDYRSGNVEGAKQPASKLTTVRQLRRPVRPRKPEAPSPKDERAHE